jgi:hypothetical protein
VKQLWIILVLAACGGGTKSGGTTPVPTPAPVEPADGNCAKEIAIRCMAPGVDGCDTKRTTSHVCVPADEVAGPPCTQEIAKQCPEGQIDACLRTPAVATNHLCIMK